MNRERFAVDIHSPRSDGGHDLYHVRGDDIDDFRRNLADFDETFPGIRLGSARPALVTPIRAAQAQLADDDGPTCPEHGSARESTKFHGLYCPQQDDAGAYCKWSWRAPKAGAK